MPETDPTAEMDQGNEQQDTEHSTPEVNRSRIDELELEMRDLRRDLEMTRASMVDLETEIDLLCDKLSEMCASVEQSTDESEVSESE